MFSIDANVNVVLTSITTSVSTGTGAEVWTKAGDYVGFETNKTAWKKVGGKREGCQITILYFIYILSFNTHLCSNCIVFLIFSSNTSTIVSRFTNSVGMKSIKLSQVVNVKSGSRQSFYVTMTTNTSYVFYGGNYTGTPSSNSEGSPTDTLQQSGSSVQNNDIVINMGTANEYPFVRVIAPRYFNGAVTYRRSQ
jgi:hypothetical protein